jgi:hypothetical protein
MYREETMSTPSNVRLAVPTLGDDLRQVAKAAGGVAVLLSMLSMGLPAILAWITEHLGPAVPIWKAFVATAPLTTSVAVIGVGVIRGRIDGLWSFLFAVAGTLLVTAGVGHALGLGGWIDLFDMWEEFPSNVFGFLLAVSLAFLENYWRIYGPQLFASSLVVGLFLAWAWGAKILPHFDRVRASAEKSGETVPRPKRRAA